MYRWTDGKSPHFTRLRPLSGPLPCYYKENLNPTNWKTMVLSFRFQILSLLTPSSCEFISFNWWLKSYYLPSGILLCHKMVMLFPSFDEVAIGRLLRWRCTHAMSDTLWRKVAQLDIWCAIEWNYFKASPFLKYELHRRRSYAIRLVLINHFQNWSYKSKSKRIRRDMGVRKFMNILFVT